MRVGIDIGTCFSRVAFLSRNQQAGNAFTLHLLKNPLNAPEESLYPSTIYIDPQGRFVIGKEAENRRERDPLNVRRNIKHFIWNTRPEIIRNKHRYYDEMLAEFIALLVKEFETRQRMSVTSVVATVPARYTQEQRNTLNQIYRRAGIRSLEFIKGPLAVIEGYDAVKPALYDREAVLVYNLGGTFDAAIVGKRGLHYFCQSIPLAHDQKDYGGGRSFDKAIYTHLQHYARGIQPEWEHFLDTRRSELEVAQTCAHAWDACRAIKHQLSWKEEATVTVHPGTGTLEPLTYSLSRATFERLIEPMVQQSIQHCSDLLHRYRLDRDIRHIFLTGGSTAIPFVKASLERRFALPVDRIDDPAAEALGAAIHGNREPEFFQQLGKTLGNAVDSLSSLLDSLDVKPDVSLMTYREAIDYFVKEIPAQAEKGAMLQQIETRGIIFTQIFLDAHNAPVLRPDGTPFGRRLWIERFDEELRDTFGSNQVVLVE